MDVGGHRVPPGRLQAIANDTRTYRFTLTVDVESDHPDYDIAEWAADAAWDSLTNDDGLEATLSVIQEVPRSEVQ